MSHSLKVYLAGPMRGLPEFNFPAFNNAAEILRVKGYEVFSPAEKDIEKYGNGLVNPTGNEDEAVSNVGFSLRQALGMDLEWVCAHGDAIALLKGWERSSGALSEFFTARALGQSMLFEYDKFSRIWTQADFPVTHVVTMNPEYNWRGQ